MCDECLVFPCAEGCPNKPELPEIPVCDFCGEPVFPGELLLRFDRAVICEACAERMSAKEALLELGAEMERAERPGEGYGEGYDGGYGEADW